MIFPVLLMKFLVFVVIRLVPLTSVAHLTSDEVSFQLHKVDLPQELWILVTSLSLYDFKVVQYCHDVLGHEDVAGVQGHPHNRHQHRIKNTESRKLVSVTECLECCEQDWALLSLHSML